jgi:hypothetical protein
VSLGFNFKKGGMKEKRAPFWPDGSGQTPSPQGENLILERRRKEIWLRSF